MKLFMLLLGCKPAGRNTEQHDIFFGIGNSLKELIPDIYEAWPEANKKIHIDAWREVNVVDEHAIEVYKKEDAASDSDDGRTKLFFLNLGGYKENEFEEFHYKMLVACADKSVAIQRARQTAFFKHTGFKGATSHVDDKYGVDVDDIFDIEEILAPKVKGKYGLRLSLSNNKVEDKMNLGYFKLDKL